MDPSERSTPEPSPSLDNSSKVPRTGLHEVLTESGGSGDEMTKSSEKEKKRFKKGE